MKKLLYFIFPSLLLLSSAPAICQNATHPLRKTDPYILHEADSIKQELTKQGFIIVKEAAMLMESGNEIPVIVPLTQGTPYQFVFIGDVTAKSYEVRMFDWDEKEVAYEKQRDVDVNGNVISYSYVPKISEYHMIKPIQVSSTKKDLFGYVMLLKKVKQ